MAITDKLKAIANAIRAKTGSIEPMRLVDMPSQIESIKGSVDDSQYNTLLTEQEALIEELKTLLQEKATGEGGGVYQYVKTTAKTNSNNRLEIINPLGGLAKKVSIKCPNDSETATKQGVLQLYTMDGVIGLGAMKLLNASTGNITMYGSRQVASIGANSQFQIDEGVIVARSYNATTATWDITCEYEVEIWQ